MEKLQSCLLIGIISSIICLFGCAHIHTDECGVDGGECNHNCYPISVLRDEDTPM